MTQQTVEVLHNIFVHVVNTLLFKENSLTPPVFVMVWAIISMPISKVNDCANGTNPANFQTCLEIIKIKTTVKLVLLKGMLDSAAR